MPNAWMLWSFLHNRSTKGMVVVILFVCLFVYLFSWLTFILPKLCVFFLVKIETNAEAQDQYDIEFEFQDSSGDDDDEDPDDVSALFNYIL